MERGFLQGLRKNEFQILGIREWWRRAEDREEWREASSMGVQGSEGAVAPLVDGWMNGRK
jgi:hypothetical protein